jgi:hypothetical protein
MDNSKDIEDIKILILSYCINFGIVWNSPHPNENMTLVIFGDHPSPLSCILHCILASPSGHLTSTHEL